MANTKKPNVLFIIVDQWSPLASDGSGRNPDLKTPNIDALAQSGVRFDEGYCSFPLCAPARASLFSGQMPHTHGVVGNMEGDCYPKDKPTLGESFANAGYDTAYFGKDHSGKIAWRGFSEFGQTVLPSCGSAAEGCCFDPVFTRDAVDFIKKDRDNPFFAVLSLVNPHDICCDPSGNGEGSLHADLARFTDEAKYLRDQPFPQLPPNFYCPEPEHMGKRAFKKYKAIDWQRYISAYYLLIENTDWLIGQALDALKQAGVEQDTIVIFTSDHGDMAGAHLMIQKCSFFEESARVPFLLSWPGQVESGQVSEDLVSHVDIFPTLCDLAGVGVPEGLAGESMKPVVMQDDSVDWRKVLVSELQDGRMLRYGDLKYMRYEIEGKRYEHLYDHATDPYEIVDIAWKPEAAEDLEKCRELLNTWMTENRDAFIYTEQPMTVQNID